MKINFRPQTVAVVLTSAIVSICVSAGYLIVGCTASQIDRAQANLTKVEAATTQAAEAAGSVAIVTPPPVQGYAATLAALLAGAVAAERLIGAYIIPLFQKKSGGSALNSTSATGNLLNPTQKT